MIVAENFTQHQKEEREEVRLDDILCWPVVSSRVPLLASVACAATSATNVICSCLLEANTSPFMTRKYLGTSRENGWSKLQINVGVRTSVIDQNYSWKFVIKWYFFAFMQSWDNGAFSSVSIFWSELTVDKLRPSYFQKNIVWTLIESQEGL